MVACEDAPKAAKKARAKSLSYKIKTEIITEPKNANIDWQIISTRPEINSSSESYLGHSPFKEERVLNIPNFTKEKSKDIVLVLKINKNGYHNIVEGLKLSQVLKDGKITKKYKLKLLKITKDYYKQEMKEAKYFSASRSSQKKSSKHPLKKTAKSKKITKTKTKKEKEKQKPAISKAAAKDPYEPNNKPKEAKAIYLNREYLAKMDSNEDMDYYKIFLGDNVKYKIKLDKMASEAEYNLDIFPYSKKHKKLYSVKTSDKQVPFTFRLKDKKRKTGVYCIRVSHISGSLGQYRLKVALVKK